MFGSSDTMYRTISLVYFAIRVRQSGIFWIKYSILKLNLTHTLTSFAVQNTKHSCKNKNTFRTVYITGESVETIQQATRFPSLLPNLVLCRDL